MASVEVRALGSAMSVVLPSAGVAMRGHQLRRSSGPGRIGAGPLCWLVVGRLLLLGNGSSTVGEESQQAKRGHGERKCNFMRAEYFKYSESRAICAVFGHYTGESRKLAADPAGAQFAGCVASKRLQRAMPARYGGAAIFTATMGGSPSRARYTFFFRSILWHCNLIWSWSAAAPAAT